MFNYVQKFLIVLFLCIVPIAAMEEKMKAALGISILAYLGREKANIELLNVIETDVIPYHQKEEEYWNNLKMKLPEADVELDPPTINITPRVAEETELKEPNKIQEEYWGKIEKCLKNGADPNLKTKIPLFLLAVKNQRKDIFNLLLRLRADINIRADVTICGMKKYQYTPLHLLVSEFLKNPGGDGIQMEDLLQNGANPNAQNKEKVTPLGLAVLNLDINFMKLLITYRADVNHKDLFGWSILSRAIHSACSSEKIKVLCDAGASLTDLDSAGNNAFHMLANSKNEELIKTIIMYGHVDFKKEPQVKEPSWTDWVYSREEIPITKTIKGALLAFNRLSYPLVSEISQKGFVRFPIIPHEIQLYILSKLFAEDYFHWGLYKELMPRYQPCPFFLLNKHVECLLQILQSKNMMNETASWSLQVKNHSSEHLNMILSLFDGSRLKHDFEEFKKLYGRALIPEDNLVGKIYEIKYCNFPKK